MGWFRRSDHADDGLYRGDAPVLLPGHGDQEPSAYLARPMTPKPDPAPPAGAQWPRGQRAPAVIVGRRRGPGAGCGLLAIVVIVVVLVGVGVAGWAVFRSVRSTFPAVRDAPATAIGAVDVPVSVDYDDARLRITVTGAQAQPGGGWGDESAEPTLIVATTIERVDDGATSVHIPFVDWTFAPDGGPPAAGIDIVSGFQPDLTSVTLDAGDTVSGLLPFDTGATAGLLALAGDRYQDPPLATWNLTAATAGSVPGTTGAAARPQIGRPPFTVTLESTAWTDQAGADAWNPPASGSFLVADLTLTSTGGESTEWVEDSAFVFVPDGGAAVTVAPPGTVSSAPSFATVGGGESAPLRAVFDVAAGPGRLEMRDAAGRTMIGWPIA